MSRKKYVGIYQYKILICQWKEFCNFMRTYSPLLLASHCILH